MKFIWMSDLHFCAEGDVQGRDPRVRLAAAIARINAHHLDAEFCVISGDLVDRGNAVDYAALKAQLAGLKLPVHVMVGNHDNRELVRDNFALPLGAMDGFVQYGMDVGGQHIVCLDTHKVGADEGEFCGERIAWLKDYLGRAGDEPVYLFMHHPPMPLGVPRLDEICMDDGTQFLDMIAGFGNVRYMFIGHVHRPICGVVHGIGFATMRSVLFQAPAPRPDWDWSNFVPAREAPSIGVVQVEGDDVVMQYEQICEYGHGVLADE